MSTVVYLNRAQFAERIGVKPPTLSRYTLPRADAITGPVDDAGEPLPGSVRGWLPETIDAWNAERPGRGARTDLEG